MGGHHIRRHIRRHVRRHIERGIRRRIEPRLVERCCHRRLAPVRGERASLRERRGRTASRVGLHAGGLDLDPGALQVGLETGCMTPLHGGACLRTERSALACDTRKTVGCDRLSIGDGDIPPQFERRERERRRGGLLVRLRSTHTRSTPTAQRQWLRQRHRGLGCIEVPVWPTTEDILDLDRQRRVLPCACLPRACRRPFALRHSKQGCRSL